MKQETLKGYCFPDKNSQWHTPAMNLNSTQEAVKYINLQKRIFSEVRIVDSDDYTVIHAIDGKIIFPIPEEGDQS